MGDNPDARRLEKLEGSDWTAKVIEDRKGVGRKFDAIQWQSSHVFKDGIEYFE